MTTKMSNEVYDSQPEDWKLGFLAGVHFATEVMEESLADVKKTILEEIVKIKQGGTPDDTSKHEPR